MAVDLESSALLQEVLSITQADGSPYLSLSAQIDCGGQTIVPLQILRIDQERDYRQGYMDNTSIVFAIGLGTLMHDIAPYQDDIKITLSRLPLSSSGKDDEEAPYTSRTYRAYLGDDVSKSIETSNSPIMQDKETADRNSIRYVQFILEEVAIEQLRKMPVGLNSRVTPPWVVLKTLFSKAKASLKLADDEALLGIEMVDADNSEPRNHIIIEDNTPLLDVPDLLQNDQGGIYSSGLGFYIQDQYIYFWPMYHTKRQSTANNILQVYIAPTRHSAMLDKTWADNGRSVSIYCAGTVKMVDDSLGKLNNEGNAVRYVDARKLVEDFGVVKDNKVTLSRTLNNVEFSGVQVGNKQNQAKNSDRRITSNVYLEASKLAKRSGAILVVPWLRSNPDLLSPGMAVEVFFDSSGEIKTLEGTLLGVNSSTELQGFGLSANVFATKSSLTLFIDRTDKDFQSFIDSGGVVSTAPQIDDF